jgi:hypothetical protein
MREAQLQTPGAPPGGRNFTSFQRANSANSADRSESLCRFGMAMSPNFPNEANGAAR